MYLVQLVLVAVSALIVSASVPTRTVSARDNIIPRSSFMSTASGNFVVNGSQFTFIGTNAYWLPALNTAEDIDFALGNMSANGIKVVRVWAFNDVETIPVNGTWFQLIANGTTTINTGPNGLQKLDTVIELAEKHNIFVLLSLTNNWNPRPLLDNITESLINSSSIADRDVTPGTNNSLPRNTLSNDYGGMDVYVRQLINGTSKQHDDFYTNPTIQTHFTNYVSTVVTRYVNKTSVFSWEIANDPRCNSSIPASSSCNTTTITMFHANVSAHIRSIDPNHLVSSGNQGFFCADCPKQFFKAPAPPQASPAPHVKRRTAKPMTKKRVLMERKVAEKKARKAQASPSADGRKIRGRWISTATKRQDSVDQGVGSAFDGSSGVDSEDIAAIGDIKFSSFSFFPDQFSYGFVNDPSLPDFNNTVNNGINWIQKHAEVGTFVGKPVVFIGFGLVTQNNTPVFVPFNTSVAPFGPDSGSNLTQPFGVTDQQRDDAYAQWINSGVTSQLQGIMQYQWTQGNLTTSPGTVISPTVAGTGLSPEVTGTGFTPNDGYGLQGVGNSQAQAQGVISQGAQAIGPDS